MQTLLEMLTDNRQLNKKIKSVNGNDYLVQSIMCISPYMGTDPGVW